MNKREIKILICSQDNQTTAFLQNTLRNEFYSFREFDDIEDAIQNLNPGDYQVIILGLCKESEKGKLNGLHAIPILRKIDPNLQIITIACDDSIEMEREARMARVFYYLLHPLDKKELRVSVKNAVRNHERLSGNMVIDTANRPNV